MENPYPTYKGFARRIDYARRRLMTLGHDPQKDIFTRAFENCFEMYDGKAVVFALMREGMTENPVLLHGIQNMGAGCFEEWERIYQSGCAQFPEQLSLF